MTPLKEPFRLSGICVGTLYRRAATPRSNWHLRVWINGEGRDFRVCLQTTDIIEARRRAFKEAFKLNGLLEAGQTVLGVTVQRLLGTFTDEQALQVQLGHLRKTSCRKQALHIAHGVQFLESRGITKDARLNSIRGEWFKDYLAWRKAECLKETGGSITARVVLQELCSIRKMFKLGEKRKLCGADQIPKWDFKIEKKVPRREPINWQDWTKAAEILRQWAPTNPPSDKAKESDQRRAYIHKLRQVAFMVMSYTGMRPDELLQLKHTDIKKIDRANGVVTGVIREETQKTKTPKDRGFTLNKSPFAAEGKGQLFNWLILWLDSWCRHKTPDDFIFGQWNNGQKKIDEIGFMGSETPDLKELLVDANLAYLTPKHARHWFTTWLVERGINVATIAEICGNSPETIQKHYYHADTMKVSDQLTRGGLEYDAEGVQVATKRKRSGKS